MEQWFRRIELERLIPSEWERTWFLDMPDVEGPYCTHGGMI